MSDLTISANAGSSIEAGASLLQLTTPFLFAGLSGAFAVAGALTAAAFWRRSVALESALTRIETRLSRDLSAERVFLVEPGRLTPATPGTEAFLAAATRSYEGAPDDLGGARLSADEVSRPGGDALQALFETQSAVELERLLRRLAAHAEPFEEIARDRTGRLWRARGEVEGAQALLRLWPEGEIEDVAEEAEETDDADIRDLIDEGFDRAPTGVVLFDADGGLRAMNAAARRLLRLRRDFGAGRRASLRTLIDTMRDSARIPERKDFDAWRDALLEDPVAGFAQEGIWALPDTSALRVAAERAAGGGLVLLITDETDATALERRYRLSINARRATFAAIDHGLAVIGADGRLHLANPAFVALWRLETSLSEERGAGQTSLAQLARDAGRDAYDAEIWSKIIAAAPLSASGPRRADRFTAPRAGDRRMEVHVSPLPEGAMLIACADVSASHRTERALADKADALEAADKLKTEFLNDIAHQLRNPLNSVIGFSEMLRQGMAGPLTNRQDEYLAYVLAAAHDLRELISDALDLGALNAGALSLRSERVDIGAICEGVMGLLAKRAERRGAEFVAELDPAPLLIDGDDTRLRHALYSAGAAVIAAATAQDRVFAALAPRRRSGDAKARVAAFGVRLERRDPIAAADDLGDSGGVALSLAKRIVEVHGGQAYFGETPERVEVILEFPLAVEDASQTASGDV